MFEWSQSFCSAISSGVPMRKPFHMQGFRHASKMFTTPLISAFMKQGRIHDIVGGNSFIMHAEYFVDHSRLC